MIDSQQQTEKTEAAIMAVFDNQFYKLTNQIIDNMRRLSTVGDKWPPILLVAFGALIIVVSVAIKIGVFGSPTPAATSVPVSPTPEVGGVTVRLGSEIVDSMEFMTLVISGAGLMLAGALFSLYQARSLRKLIMAQQLVGTEILNKQIDIEKDVLVRNHAQQQGQLILLPGKKHKRFRR